MNAELGRFVIRDLEPWEGASVFRLTGDPKATRYMGFRRHVTEAQATDLITRYKGPNNGRWLAICPKENPVDVLGIVGLEIRGHAATMSLMFRSDWKARGAGIQFAEPFAAWVMTHPTIWRLWSYVHVDNLLGQRATLRTGAKLEGRLRRFEYFPNISDEPQDVYVYSIVRDDLT
jgi:RimJ/RimL family protein N-acetyltransferase